MESDAQLRYFDCCVGGKREIYLNNVFPFYVQKSAWISFLILFCFSQDTFCITLYLIRIIQSESEQAVKEKHLLQYIKM